MIVNITKTEKNEDEDEFFMLGDLKIDYGIDTNITYSQYNLINGSDMLNVKLVQFNASAEKLSKDAPTTTDKAEEPIVISGKVDISDTSDDIADNIAEELELYDLILDHISLSMYGSTGNSKLESSKELLSAATEVYKRISKKEELKLQL